MSPSSTVHGGQHDIKYVTFELLLHATFVADEIWGVLLEPARSGTLYAPRYEEAFLPCRQKTAAL